MTETATAVRADTTPAPQRTAQRIPLNTFAIGFGLAGLATVWTTAGRLLGVPEAVGQVLWVGVTVAWAWLIVAHLYRGARSAETLVQQLRHPAQGPIAALAPVVGMLIGADLYQFVPVAGAVLVIASIVTAAAFAAWLLAYWHAGTLPPEAFHGGYLLPTVAAGLIAATTSFKIGLPMLAIGSFAVGMLFWVIVTTVLLARLAFFTPLPAALVPTCAILLAPPAVAGIAWFTINGGHADLLSKALLGVLVLMVLQQIALIPRYRVLPFSLGFWSFTFPVAAAGGYGIEWLAISGFDGWQVVAWVLVGVVTVVIALVGIRSLVLITSVKRGVAMAESVLRRADNAIERR